MAAGLDSLASVELLTELGSTWSLELPGTLMFDYPTVESMAGFIHGRLVQLAGAGTQSSTTNAQNETKSLHSAAPIAPEWHPASHSHTPPAHHTAILGIQCRLPAGATNAQELAFVFQEGAEAVQEIPFERWDVDSAYSPLVPSPGRSYSRFGRFLDAVANFDAALLQMSRAEALGLDPQHRLLLEESVTVLRNSAVRLRTGVYAGCMYQEYGTHVLGPAGLALNSSAALGNSLSFMVGRVAYTFGLTGEQWCTDFFMLRLWWMPMIAEVNSILGVSKMRNGGLCCITADTEWRTSTCSHNNVLHSPAHTGPCISTDTACSSSLVASHLGHCDILSSRADGALVAGVNLMLSPATTVAICQLQVF